MTNLVTDDDIRANERANTIKSLKQSHWKVSEEKGAAQLLSIKPSTLAYRITNFNIKKNQTADINHGLTLNNN